MTKEPNHAKAIADDLANFKRLQANRDKDAELAMLMDLNGINRDKTDPEFEHRVMIRKSQNIG